MNSKIVSVIALLIAIVIFFGYVQPTWVGSIAETKSAIDADNQALDAASRYKTQQNQLVSARNAINAKDLERLQIFLPDSVDNVGLILDLNALAARSGLSLSNVDVTTSGSGTQSKGVQNGSVQQNGNVGTGMANPQQAVSASTVAASPVSSVDLSLSAMGSYTALQGFLQSLERSQRLLDVRDLVVKGSSTGVYTYQMKIRLYWLH